MYFRDTFRRSTAGAHMQSVRAVQSKRTFPFLFFLKTIPEQVNFGLHFCWSSSVTGIDCEQAIPAAERARPATTPKILLWMAMSTVSIGSEGEGSVDPWLRRNAATDSKVRIFPDVPLPRTTRPWNHRRIPSAPLVPRVARSKASRTFATEGRSILPATSGSVGQPPVREKHGHDEPEN